MSICHPRTYLPAIVALRWPVPVTSLRAQVALPVVGCLSGVSVELLGLPLFSGNFPSSQESDILGIS